MCVMRWECWTTYTCASCAHKDCKQTPNNRKLYTQNPAKRAFASHEPILIHLFNSSSFVIFHPQKVLYIAAPMWILSLKSMRGEAETEGERKKEREQKNKRSSLYSSSSSFSQFASFSVLIFIWIELDSVSHRHIITFISCCLPLI